MESRFDLVSKKLLENKRLCIIQKISLLEHSLVKKGAETVTEDMCFGRIFAVKISMEGLVKNSLCYQSQNVFLDVSEEFLLVTYRVDDQTVKCIRSMMSLLRCHLYFEVSLERIGHHVSFSLLMQNF